MYRNNYLVKKQSGIYKNREAIYRSDATASDFVVSKPHLYRQFNEFDTDSRNTKINYSVGTNIILTMRVKNV